MTARSRQTQGTRRNVFSWLSSCFEFSWNTASLWETQRKWFAVCEADPPAHSGGTQPAQDMEEVTWAWGGGGWTSPCSKIVRPRRRDGMDASLCRFLDDAGPRPASLITECLNLWELDKAPAGLEPLKCQESGVSPSPTSFPLVCWEFPTARLTSPKAMRSLRTRPDCCSALTTGR